MLYAMILVCVVFTSTLSGVLGMAGGMILMTVLVLSLNVASAMLLHGAVQAMANGSRAWLLRRNIRWRLLPLYLIGAALALGGFTLLAVVPNVGLVLLLVGLFPWLARVSGPLQGLDVTRPATTIACGLIVTSAQLLAGASGPLLDVFYLRAPLTRYEVVANKALTQALGHMLKIVYYGFVISVSSDLPLWLFAVAIGCAVLGTRLGTRLLERWNDADFRKVSQAIILIIATYCVGQGLWMLFI
jgi:uncharacterized membrane protein YfcA